MKKITNRIGICVVFSILLSLYSCNNNDKKEAEQAKTEAKAKFNTVVAIGKVLPADGWIQISSAVDGEVQEVLVKEGDEVAKGQVLIQLKEKVAGLDLAQSKTQLESLEAQQQVRLSDLEKEKIILEDLQSKYETSKILYDKNAETKEKLNSDLSNLKQQQELILSLKKQIQADKITAKEQAIIIEKSKINQQDFQVLANKKGIITELNVEVGQTINSSDELGKMVDNQNIIIEAEVDELFADSVQIGQSVEINFVGKSNSIGKGKIIYVSPTLMNKSILFETANEAEDRRVRRIKIEPEKSQSYLINSKVECRIKLN